MYSDVVSVVCRLVTNYLMCKAWTTCVDWRSHKEVCKDGSDVASYASKCKPRFVPITEPGYDDRELLKEVPLFVVEIVDPAFEEHCKAGVKSQGGLHPCRVEHIKKIVVIEPDFSQAYLARRLHANCHYQILRDDLGLYESCCGKLGIDLTVVRQDEFYRMVDCGRLGPSGAWGKGRCSLMVKVVNFKRGVRKRNRKKMSSTDRLMEKALKKISTERLFNLAMTEYQKGKSERGNYQASIGGQRRDYCQAAKGMAMPSVSPQVRTFESDLVGASMMVEAMGYQGPKQNSDDYAVYEQMQKACARVVDEANNLDALTGMCSFYRYKRFEPPSDPDHVKKRDLKRENLAGQDLRSAVAVDEVIRTKSFAIANILGCHVDEGNARDVGRDACLGVMQIGHLYEWVCEDDGVTWSYQKTGLVRAGGTFYCKHVISCFVRKTEWMEPVIDEIVDYYKSLPEWQRKIECIFDAEKEHEREDGGVRFSLHSDLMSLISQFASPIMRLHGKFGLTQAQMVEMLQIVAIANSPHRFENEVLSWCDEDQLPDRHLAEHYFERTKAKYGACCGGRFPRNVVAFNKAIPRRLFYMGSRRLLESLVAVRETIESPGFRRTCGNLRKAYENCCRELMTVPTVGELACQRLLKVACLTGLVNEPTFLQFGFIPSGTQSGQRVMEHIMRVTGCSKREARKLFKANRGALIQTLSRVLSEVEGRPVSESTAENLVCKGKLVTTRLEFLLDGRMIYYPELRRIKNAKDFDVIVSDRIIVFERGKDGTEFKPPILRAPLRGRQKRRISWEDAGTDLASLIGADELIYPTVEADEFVGLFEMQRDKGDLSCLQDCWSNMTKQRQESILEDLPEVIASIVLTWRRTNEPIRCKGGRKKPVERQIVSAKKRNREERNKVGHLISDVLGGHEPATRLCPWNEAIIRVQKREEPTPWSPSIPKPAIRASKRECNGDLVRKHRKRLEKVDKKLKAKTLRIVPDVYHLLMDKAVAVPTRTGKRTYIDSMEDPAGKSEVKADGPGEYHFEPEHIIETCFERISGSTSRRSASFACYCHRANDVDPTADADLIGMYATIIYEGIEYDYSRLGLFRETLPETAGFRDPNGRVLYKTMHHAKAAACLNAAFDVPMGSDPDYDALQRICVSSPLFCSKMVKYGRNYVFNKSLFRYMALHLAGESKNGRKESKPYLVLLEKTTTSGRKEHYFGMTERADYVFQQRAVRESVRLQEARRQKVDARSRQIATGETQRLEWKSVGGLLDHRECWPVGKPVVPHSSSKLPRKYRQKGKRRRGSYNTGDYCSGGTSVNGNSGSKRQKRRHVRCIQAGGVDNVQCNRVTGAKVAVRRSVRWAPRLVEKRTYVAEELNEHYDCV